MIRFLFSRLFTAGLVLAAMSFVIFALIDLMPGDPPDQAISADLDVTSEGIARLRQIYGVGTSVSEIHLSISMPSFWLSLMLIYLFAVTGGWLPAGGMPRAREGLGAMLAHLVLPVLTLVIVEVGGQSDPCGLRCWMFWGRTTSGLRPREGCRPRA